MSLWEWLFRRRERDDELEDEIQAHLDMAARGGGPRDRRLQIPNSDLTPRRWGRNRRLRFLARPVKLARAREDASGETPSPPKGARAENYEV
jgi:hypothetical protein